MLKYKYSLVAVLLLLLSACGTHVKKTSALPGYYQQWLYIKTNGSNVLPDMRQYNWTQNSNKRAVSNALLNVVELGPNNVGGRIRAIVIDKANTNRIIIGGASGGVFISENKGSSWRPINDQAVSPSVTYMDQNPLTPSVIYYCTGEASGNSADLIGAGVFKSVDGGNTFTQLAATNNTNFSFCWSVKCSPIDTNTLFVATHNAGLWRSNDAGLTFSRVYNTGTQINDLEILPDGAVMFTIKGSGAYRSATGAINTFSKVASINSTQSARAELAYCRNFPDVVYAAISGPDNSYNGVLKAFYKSSDGGKTFVEKGNPNGTVNFGFTWYCMSMSVKDNDSNSIFISGVDVGYSKNGGVSWSAGNEMHADNQVSIFSGNNLYLGSDGGLCVYDWSNPNVYTSLNNGINITQFYHGDVSPHSNEIFGGTQDNGTIQSINSNKIFSNVFGGDGGYSFYHANDANIKYYATQNGAVYRNGVTISNNIPTSDPKHFIHPYHVNATQGNYVVYPSGTNLYFSKNAGSSFTLAGSVKVGRFFSAASSNDANPSIFSGGSAAFIAIDSILNTTPIVKDLRLVMPPILRSSFIGGITVYPGYRDKVFLALNNISDSGRVYLASELFSAKPIFKNISGNLPKGLPVNWVECDPLNSSKVIFAGTDYGLYITEDGGFTWIKDTRIPSTVISNIKIHKNNKDIYFFTHGRGIFKGQINNAGISSINEGFTASVKIYPVPASKQISVEFESSITGSYELIDTKGSSLLSGNFEGKLIEINTSILSTGSYVLICKTSEGIISRSIAISQ
jgi:photosystem II stability/assembly factor-like uncharacterized protein